MLHWLCVILFSLGSPFLFYLGILLSFVGSILFPIEDRYPCFRAQILFCSPSKISSTFKISMLSSIFIIAFLCFPLSSLSPFSRSSVRSWDNSLIFVFRSWIAVKPLQPIDRQQRLWHHSFLVDALVLTSQHPAAEMKQNSSPVVCGEVHSVFDDQNKFIPIYSNFYHRKVTENSPTYWSDHNYSVEHSYVIQTYGFIKLGINDLYLHYFERNKLWS